MIFVMSIKLTIIQVYFILSSSQPSENYFCRYFDLVFWGSVWFFSRVATSKAENVAASCDFNIFMYLSEF